MCLLMMSRILLIYLQYIYIFLMNMLYRISPIYLLYIWFTEYPS